MYKKLEGGGKGIFIDFIELCFSSSFNFSNIFKLLKFTKHFHQASSRQWVHEFSVKWRMTEQCQQGIQLTGTRWCLTQYLQAMRHPVAFLIPSMTSWEQCQGQANHYLQLMTWWRLYTLEFLFLLFLLNSSLSSLGFDCTLSGTRIIFSVFGKRPESPQTSLHAHSHQKNECWLADIWNGASPQGAVCSSLAVTHHKAPRSFLQHEPTPSCLSALAELSHSHPN